MSIYNLLKSTVPLPFRIWFRRDARMLFQRAGARLRGSGPVPPRDLIHLVIGGGWRLGSVDGAGLAGKTAIEEGHAAVHKTVFRNSVQHERLESFLRRQQ